MKLNNIKEVEDFNKAIEQAKGSVWLEIKQIGNKINDPILSVDMKSGLSRYVALGKLIEHSANDDFNYYFELYCQYPEDEQLFFKFFEDYPDALKEKENKK